jgi:hypothetical protein
MMEKLKGLVEIWKGIYKKPKNILTALIIAIIFYLLNVLITTFSSLKSIFGNSGFFQSIKLFFLFSVGFHNAIRLHTYIIIIIISLLIGFLFSLIIYKSKANIKNKYKGKSGGAFGIIGTFLAVFVPGCAACGVGLISLLGLGAGLVNFLPLKGIEISLVSIIILLIAIYQVTKNMYVCKIN